MRILDVLRKRRYPMGTNSVCASPLLLLYGFTGLAAPTVGGRGERVRIKEDSLAQDPLHRAFTGCALLNAKESSNNP